MNNLKKHFNFLCNKIGSHLYGSEQEKQAAVYIEKNFEKYGLMTEIQKFPTGIDPLATFKFDYGKDSQAIVTLFTQEMLKRGYLSGKSVYLSYSHKEKDIKKYLKEVEDVFRKIKYAIENKRIYNLLEGPVAQEGFRRLT